MNIKITVLVFMALTAGVFALTRTKNAAPVDGSPSEGAGPNRVIRGGSFYDESPGYLRADFRNIGDPGDRYGFIGFRLARQGR